MEKRAIANPDDADAVALTFACSVAREAVVAEPTYWRPPPVRRSRYSCLGDTRMEAVISARIRRTSVGCFN
jgi:hypothetical protein